MSIGRDSDFKAIVTAVLACINWDVQLNLVLPVRAVHEES